eukprot:TRINITY_DN1827_c0_g1_i1.p1 TRINITY_DN1827_c0_g1~~TRINITY_DN1827_c0_g1_i1.p1  ORF type:complete len:464 (+),score=167.28 TRINITY_DN1827_c0_g1_i1:56-1447(+)
MKRSAMQHLCSPSSTPPTTSGGRRGWTPVVPRAQHCVVPPPTLSPVEAKCGDTPVGAVSIAVDGPTQPKRRRKSAATDDSQELELWRAVAELADKCEPAEDPCSSDEETQVTRIPETATDGPQRSQQWPACDAHPHVCGAQLPDSSRADCGCSDAETDGTGSGSEDGDADGLPVPERIAKLRRRVDYLEARVARRAGAAGRAAAAAETAKSSADAAARDVDARAAEQRTKADNVDRARARAEQLRPEAVAARAALAEATRRREEAEKAEREAKQRAEHADAAASEAAAEAAAVSEVAADSAARWATARDAAARLQAELAEAQQAAAAAERRRQAAADAATAAKERSDEAVVAAAEHVLSEFEAVEEKLEELVVGGLVSRKAAFEMAGRKRRRTSQQLERWRRTYTAVAEATQSASALLDSCEEYLRKASEGAQKVAELRDRVVCAREALQTDLAAAATSAPPE